MQVLSVTSPLAAALLMLAAVLNPAKAASAPPDADIFALKLGTAAAGLATEPYFGFACGDAGGPPGRPVASWTDYARCPADAAGLRAVSFRIDDEQEYVALAQDQPDLAKKLGGSRISGYPVRLALLFDRTGTVAGIDIASDDRVPVTERGQSFLLGKRLMDIYGADGWSCSDLPLADGESPVGRTAVKEDCTGSLGTEGRLFLQVRLLRRPGQEAAAIRPGAEADGAFESSARLRVLADGVPPPPGFAVPQPAEDRTRPPAGRSAPDIL